MNFFRKILRIILIIIAIILILLGATYFYREAILQQLGLYLTQNQAPEKAEVMFVLSGKPIERGIKAASIYKKKFVPKIICTGSIIDSVFLRYDIHTTEAEITSKVIAQEGVDKKAISLLKVGTSTYEECQAITQYCREKQIRKAIILSSVFHSRRIRWILKQLKTPEDETTFIVCGAPAREYKESEWWKKEHGLIFVNNEYMKLIYYKFKY